MNLPQPLHEARLIRRYKRFLSDMRLADGREVVAHCPNPGSMKTCAGADWRVQISHNTNPRRKLKWTWELAYDDLGHPILINTSRPNAIVEEAVRAGGIAELTGYPSVRREVRYGAEKSRIDLLLSGPDRPDCYVEIKSVTMRSGELGAFPDSVTKRGQRHLRELTAMAAAGHRAVLFFLLSRGGLRGVRPADEIDPVYGEGLRAAASAGVEVLAYQASFGPGTVSVGARVPVILAGGSAS
jgi:sugar fermentation stimulation protein A